MNISTDINLKAVLFENLVKALGNDEKYKDIALNLLKNTKNILDASFENEIKCSVFDKIEGKDLTNKPELLKSLQAFLKIFPNAASFFSHNHTNFHMLLLQAKSHAFADDLVDLVKIDEEGELSDHILNIQTTEFKNDKVRDIIFNYIETGDLSLSHDIVLEIFDFAHKYEFLELELLCKDFIVSQHIFSKSNDQNTINNSWKFALRHKLNWLKKEILSNENFKETNKIQSLKKLGLNTSSKEAIIKTQDDFNNLKNILDLSIETIVIHTDKEEIWKEVFDFLSDKSLPVGGISTLVIFYFYMPQVSVGWEYLATFLEKESFITSLGIKTKQEHPHNFNKINASLKKNKSIKKLYLDVFETYNKETNLAILDIISSCPQLQALTLNKFIFNEETANLFSKHISELPINELNLNIRDYDEFPQIAKAIQQKSTLSKLTFETYRLYNLDRIKEFISSIANSYIRELTIPIDPISWSNNAHSIFFFISTALETNDNITKLRIELDESGEFFFTLFRFYLHNTKNLKHLQLTKFNPDPKIMGDLAKLFELNRSIEILSLVGEEIDKKYINEAFKDIFKTNSILKKITLNDEIIMYLGYHC